MKRFVNLLLILWLAGYTSASFAIGASGVGLCSADEECFFCCQVKRSAKWLSLCGKDIGPSSKAGYLQYRFGRRARPEFEFPATRERSLGDFLYAGYSRAGVLRTEIRFSNGNVEYTIFDYVEDDASRSGVRVVIEGAQGKDTEIECAGKARSALSRLKSTLACDKESALSGGCQ